jgi:hypothetical protein
METQVSLFPEYDETLDVYEYTEPSGWSEAGTVGTTGWSYIGSIVGRIEPVAANEELLNRQDYQGITEVCFLDLQYDGIVKPNHYLVDSRSIVYQNRGIPETWRHLIPYVMLKLERPQSPVVIPVST